MSNSTFSAKAIRSQLGDHFKNLGFIKYDHFLDTFVLSLASGIPIIYWGKGGYAKTEMIKAAMACLGGKTITVECDAETTASHFKGHSVIKTKKHKDHDITSADHDLDTGIITADNIFLEEFLDSTFNAQSVLKAMITNKVLHFNGKPTEVKYQCLMAATNQDPVQLLRQLPHNEKNSYDALLQRFLIIEHKWNSHDEDDYMTLALKQRRSIQRDFATNKQCLFSTEQIKMLRADIANIEWANTALKLLASLAEKSHNQGSTVSPRVFMWTMKLAQAFAAMQDKATVTDADLWVLTLFSSWSEEIKTDLTNTLHRQSIILAAQEKLGTYQQWLTDANELVRMAEKDKDLKALILLRKELNQKAVEMQQIQLPDEKIQTYDQLQSSLKNFLTIIDGTVDSLVS